MTFESILHQKISRCGFWAVIAFFITAVLSMFFPLDIAGGYAAAHGDRVVWLQENRGMFIAGWVNQIISMFTLSGAFAAAAWIVVGNNALRGMLGLFFVAMATMGFIIPKFIAVWTIPLLGDAASTGSTGSDMAHALLPLLNVSIPFSLYTSFDYLGFWLYAVFALLIAGPLYGDALSNKIAAVSLGVFGVLYHLCLIALLLGSIGASDIETYFLGSTVLLFLHLVAMIAVFYQGRSNADAADTVP
ncbi:MAG: hypothetical protein CMP94_03785 [Gammaproteobacteria bacterium]|nr:hypothetical protein [Gammaproteobacteria bacterium]